MMSGLPRSPRGITSTLLAILVGVLPILAIAACATIMHGTSQEVGISSQPSGARVTIDNQPKGNTPLVADLKRKKEHLVRIEMDGYQPYEMHVTNSVSGWVWGNIVFGGIVGLAVDAISGGLYKLEPEQIEAGLASTSGARLDSRDGLMYIQVTLQPEPGWERIGTLEVAR